MELADGKKDVVDPEVRAYVSSLVTALGGSGADEDGRYVLGDDALACLRDLKKWLKLYDEKANRLDVARCLAESNLVGGDLLQILAAWPENATEDRIKSKIALACLELLVALTWPLEKDAQPMTKNHHRHVPFLQIAQLGYKRSIINYDGARILHTAIRCALPSMAEGMGDRSARDEGIIKLVLYFLRNMAMIAPPTNTQYDGDEADISRSATIDAFDYQDVFHLLLTASSTMGEDFNTQDVVILDILFYLIKGVDVEKLFVDEKKAKNSNMDELTRLRNKEAAMLRSYEQDRPTRHNRFGTMAWMQRENAKMTTVSGQAALLSTTGSLAKMDSTKKFRPSVRKLKAEDGHLDFDIPVPLNVRATKNLRTFVENFLDSGFNPLFNHIRKAIDREAERVMDYHQRQFFYLVSWFLEAERVRRQSKKASNPKAAKPQDLDSFSLVASVLNQEMFVALNRAMDSTFENKSWSDLKAAMKCFTQILLTVQEMSESPLEEDQEIAENILNRIFYEETTHDRVANITRTYKDQGFGYLDSCTELTHNYLRILENYSKQNTDMQVRSRRRVRKKKNQHTAIEGQDNPNLNEEDESNDDEAGAERVSRERKFDFKRFSARFLTQGCIDTFITFTRYFSDLKPAQLKRSHRFIYRVAFKQDMSVMLFRVDIIALLHKMIKGPEGLDPQHSCFKEWNELVRQVLKRCTKKIEERPELIVEMLFSKINSTAHYLEYGYEKQTVSAKPRAAAMLEVKGEREWEDRIGIVIGAMLDKNEGDHIQWVKTQLVEAESERRSWEGANSVSKIPLPSVEDDPVAITELPTDAPPPITEVGKPQPPTLTVKTDNSTRQIATFKNGHLRLLMTLIGFQRTGDTDNPEALWTIPSSQSADQLEQCLNLIKKFEFAPPTFDDGEEAGDFIKRRNVAAPARNREKPIFGDDDSLDDGSEEELLFEPGGPTSRRPADALKALKRNRRLRRKDNLEDGEDSGPSDQVLEARAAARRAKDHEKNRKIKSSLYVHDSDEEEDDERDRAFFEAEERLRQKTSGLAKGLLGNDFALASQTASTKRKSFDSEDDEDEDDIPSISASLSRRKRQSSAISADSDASKDAEDEDDATDTPMSSPHPKTASQAKRRKVVSDDEDEDVPASSAPRIEVKAGSETMAVDNDEDGDVDDVPAVRAKPRRTAGFIVDSSDEE